MLTNDTRARRAALDEVSKISFTIDELRLYLDTHPHCTEARQMIEHHCAHRARLVEEYTVQFGPIVAYKPGTESCWAWNEGPMPWEGDC